MSPGEIDEASNDEAGNFGPPRRSRSSMRRGLVLLPMVVSLSFHGVAAIGAARLPVTTRAPELFASAQAITAPPVRVARAWLKKERAQAARVRLIEDAEAKLLKKELSLGTFLLAANAIDAFERDETLAREPAAARYRDRVEALRTELDHHPTEEAVATVFGDLSYTGTPGGTIAELLETQSGSCEPTSQLIAAALYDLGRGSDVELRFFGGAVGGATHLMVTARTKSGPIDLMLGTLAPSGGSSFAPEGLVRSYARAHHLETMPSPPGDKSTPSEVARGDRGNREAALFAKPSLSAGYPPNTDRFEGRLPLFGGPAVHAVSTAKGVTDGEISVEDPEWMGCHPDVQTAWLDPPSIASWTKSGVSELRLRRSPSRTTLVRLSGLVLDAERARDLAAPRSGRRLLALACIVAVSSEIADGAALIGERDSARRAADIARANGEEGRKLLEEISWGSNPEGARIMRELTKLGPSNAILFLPSGERLLAEKLAGESAGFERVLDAAAAIVGPSSRPSVLPIVARWPPHEQVNVMHEVYFTHDLNRPWASNYALDSENTPTSFERAYGCFRPLAWRFWEAGLSATFPEAIDDVKECGALPQEMQAAIYRYLLDKAEIVRAKEGASLSRLRQWMIARGFDTQVRESDRERLPQKWVKP